MELTADRQLTVYGNKCMQAGTAAPRRQRRQRVTIADCTGAAVQHWNVGAGGAVTPAAAPGLCLDASGAGTGNGTAVDLWYCNGQPNQSWSLKDATMARDSRGLRRNRRTPFLTRRGAGRRARCDVGLF